MIIKNIEHINKAELYTVAVKTDQFPTDGLPEIVFCGKSNVGKSSLINTMVMRKALARTSQNPGKTRTINFFNVEDTVLFVDLPGYGYAKISKEVSAQWGKMIENYLQGRSELALILMLVDIRHEPGANDVQMYNWLKHYNYPMAVVATKADKLSRSQLQKHTSIIRKTLNMGGNEPVLTFSSLKKMGREELWKLISNSVFKNEENVSI